MVDDSMQQLARQITEAEPSIRMRIGVITAIEATGSRRVQTDQTSTAWLSCDKDSFYTVGDRVWMMQQGGVFVVAGRLSGEPAGVPIGTILAFAGSTPPPGWMAADGTAINRTTYAALYALTGVGYGAGDGSTTFNLPDLGAKFPIGAKGAAPTLASTGGAATVTLTTAQIPAHDHGASGSHNHTALGSASVTVASGAGATPSNSTTANTGGTGSHQHTSVGSGAAHENLPPYLAILYIIRVL
jgi:microcystin-dependent protein